MPQSGRKTRPKTPRPRRIQVTDENGWTHIATDSLAARKALRNTAKAPVKSDAEEDGIKQLIAPAEAPQQQTLEELLHQLGVFQRRWQRSSTWLALHETLHDLWQQRQQQQQQRCRADKKAQEMPDGLDKSRCACSCQRIVCLGLGSPSGFLRGGLVDRRMVSMYQLAALVSIVEQADACDDACEAGEGCCEGCGASDKQSRAICRAGKSRGCRGYMQVFAQDPVFNTLDRALLAGLGIAVVEHPAAFELVDASTFLFCPGAEKVHLEQLVVPGPALLFGGPLEDTGSEPLDSFLDTTESCRLPAFDACEHAFWNMRLYWRK